MRSLSDADLLRLWEGGLRSHPVDRALQALNAAIPEMAYQQLADWPLGRRNEALIEFRCQCFGHDLRGWVACARCYEKLEFAIDGQTIALAGKNRDQSAGGNDLDATIVVNHQTFRLPSSRDLATAAMEEEPRGAAIRILESCRLTHCADADSTDIDDSYPQSWSDEEIEEIGERMAAADPLAETRLTLHCPKCENDWEETLDIVSFVWSEIEARARRLLLEIHTLASAYGWTEAEILSLGENRRARYVEMVQS
jgi:hypothetical protein